MPVEFPIRPTTDDVEKAQLLDPWFSLRMLLDPESPLTPTTTIPGNNGRLQVDMLTQTDHVPNPKIEAETSDDQPKEETLLDLYLKAYRALSAK